MSINWAAITAKLPAGRDEESKKLRAELFSDFDPNSNGFLSLAEVEKGIRDVLRLDQVFKSKAVIMRAFTAAKSANSAKGRSKLSDDFIEKNEFRLLMVYLRQYFELHHMFDTIDTDDDKRVEFDEFKQALDKIKAWGLEVKDPKAEFNKIDTNHGGFILFDEFCNWALKHKLDLEDDDD
jgi:hypothetical protein